MTNSVDVLPFFPYMYSISFDCIMIGPRVLYNVTQVLFLPSVCLICWEAIVNIGCIVPLFHCIGFFFSVVVTLQFLPFLRNATIEHMSVCVCVFAKILNESGYVNQRTRTYSNTISRYCCCCCCRCMFFFCCCSSFAVLYLNMF